MTLYSTRPGPLWVIHDRVEPASKSGHVSFAAEAWERHGPHRFVFERTCQRFAGGSVCTLQLAAESEAWACGIRPGSGTP